MAMHITVRDILNLPILSECSVVAGFAGLSNEISTVSFIESPDSFGWVREHDFLVTNGYLIKKTEGLEKSIIRSLHEAKASGLGIKLNRHLSEIPEQMITQAEELSFPLLVLPYGVAPSQIIEVITEAIHVEKILQRGAGIKRLNASLPLQDNLVRIANMLEDVLDNQVIIYLDYSGEFVGGDKAAGYFLPLAKMFAAKESTCNTFSDMEMRVLSEVNGTRYYVDYQGRQELVAVIPIEVRKRIGDIYILEQKPMNGEKIVAIRFFVPIIHLLVDKDKQLSSMKEYKKQSFLYDLLFKQVTDEHVLRRKAFSVGWDLNKMYGLLVVRPSSAKHLPELSHMLDTMYDDNIASCLAYGDEMIVFYEIRDADTAKDQLVGFGQEILEKCREGLRNVDARVGIGRFYANALDLRKSYDEARKCLDLHQCLDNNEVIYFDDLGVYRLFMDLTENEAYLRSYYQETIAKLIDYDNDNSTDYYNTVVSYIRHNGNIKEIAAEIFVHYNTVRYRIQKLKEMGIDLEDPDKRFELHIGIKIHELLESHNG